MKLLTTVFLLLLLKTLCPIHGETNPYWTGKTKNVGGKIAYQYKCYRGPHFFWAAPK